MTSPRKPSRLSSFFDSSSYTEDLVKFDDILNEALTVIGVNWRHGQNGDYAIITLILDSTGSEMKVSCGGIAICDALRAAETNRNFPFQAQVIKKGRMFLFVDVE